MKEICKDLAAEGQALDNVVADLDEATWLKETPFYGWTIKDEISHLAYFDRLVRYSASDEGSFNSEMEEIVKDLENFFQNTLKPGLAMGVPDLLEWWRKERKGMIEAFEPMDPKTRLPWHLPMSARSSATARLMETWAHGQDIVDALGAHRPPTNRLRHIAHLGVATFGWSFSCRNMEAPSEPVQVVLTAPSGEPWTWGPEEAENTVSGAAEDFCLVVAQRRHYKDTNLAIKGDIAEKWMTVAQVFAGPPATGPEPGKFPPSPAKSTGSST